MTEIDLNITQEKEVLEPKTVMTSITKIVGAYFDFSNTRCHIFVEYGNETDGAFSALDRKELVVSGAYYAQKISIIPNNTDPMATQFTNVLARAVNEIHGDQALKDSLVASNELIIRDVVNRGDAVFVRLIENQS